MFICGNTLNLYSRGISLNLIWATCYPMVSLRHSKYQDHTFKWDTTDSFQILTYLSVLIIFPSILSL